MAVRIVEALIGKYLRLFVKGFSSDQISLHFLKGHGEMRDVELNCEAVNALMEDFPLLKFTRISVNQLRISAPFTKFQSKPIVISIDQCILEVIEPLEYVAPKNESASASSSLHKYGLADRLGDGITVEVARVQVIIRTLGAKKSSTGVGPWRPPPCVIRANNVRLATTNAAGTETPLDVLWEQARARSKIDLYVYKKFTAESIDLTLLDEGPVCEGISEKPKEYVIIPPIPLTMFFTWRKRQRDCKLLGYQMEISLDHVQLNLSIKDPSYTMFIRVFFGVYQSLYREERVLPAIEGAKHHDLVARSMEENPKGNMVSDKEACLPPSLEALSQRQDIIKNDCKAVEFIPDQDGAWEDDQSVSSKDLESASDADLRDFEVESQLGIESLAESQFENESQRENDEDKVYDHERNVMVISINRCDVNLEYSEEMAASGPTGVVLQTRGFVYEGIMPEDKPITETYTQMSLHHLCLKEIGVPESYHPGLIVPVFPPQDVAGDKTPYPELVPRGVLEEDDQDPELDKFTPRQFMVVKMHDIWPPPAPPAVGAETEVWAERCRFTLESSAWDRVIKAVRHNWDSRWVSGAWDIDGVVEQIQGNGISIRTLKCEGFEFKIPSPMGLDNILPRTGFRILTEKVEVIFDHTLPRTLFDKDPDLLDQYLHSKPASFPSRPTDISVQDITMPRDDQDLLPQRWMVTVSGLQMFSTLGNEDVFDMLPPSIITFWVSVDPKEGKVRKAKILNGIQNEWYVVADQDSSVHASLLLQCFTLNLDALQWVQFHQAMSCHWSVLSNSSSTNASEHKMDDVANEEDEDTYPLLLAIKIQNTKMNIIAHDLITSMFQEKKDLNEILVGVVNFPDSDIIFERPIPSESEVINCSWMMKMAHKGITIGIAGHDLWALGNPTLVPATKESPMKTLPAFQYQDFHLPPTGSTDSKERELKEGQGLLMVRIEASPPDDGTVSYHISTHLVEGCSVWLSCEPFMKALNKLAPVLGVYMGGAPNNRDVEPKKGEEDSQALELGTVADYLAALATPKALSDPKKSEGATKINLRTQLHDVRFIVPETFGDPTGSLAVLSMNHVKFKLEEDNGKQNIELDSMISAWCVQHCAAPKSSGWLGFRRPSSNVPPTPKTHTFVPPFEVQFSASRPLEQEPSASDQEILLLKGWQMGVDSSLSAFRVNFDPEYFGLFHTILLQQSEQYNKLLGIWATFPNVDGNAGDENLGIITGHQDLTVKLSATQTLVHEAAQVSSRLMNAVTLQAQSSAIAQARLAGSAHLAAVEAAAATSTYHCFYSGWVYKGGGTSGSGGARARIGQSVTFHKYWAVLEMRLLLLFDCPNSSKVQFVFPLTGCHLSTDIPAFERKVAKKQNMTRHMFALTDCNGGSVFFAVQSEVVMLSWVSHLTIQINSCSSPLYAMNPVNLEEKHKLMCEEMLKVFEEGEDDTAHTPQQSQKKNAIREATAMLKKRSPNVAKRMKNINAKKMLGRRFNLQKNFGKDLSLESEETSPIISETDSSDVTSAESPHPLSKDIPVDMALESSKQPAVEAEKELVRQHSFSNRVQEFLMESDSRFLSPVEDKPSADGPKLLAFLKDIKISVSCILLESPEEMLYNIKSSSREDDPLEGEIPVNWEQILHFNTLLLQRFGAELQQLLKGYEQELFHNSASHLSLIDEKQKVIQHSKNLFLGADLLVGAEKIMTYTSAPSSHLQEQQIKTMQSYMEIVKAYLLPDCARFVLMFLGFDMEKVLEKIQNYKAPNLGEWLIDSSKPLPHNVLDRSGSTVSHTQDNQALETLPNLSGMLSNLDLQELKGKPLKDPLRQSAKGDISAIYKEQQAVFQKLQNQLDLAKTNMAVQQSNHSTELSAARQREAKLQNQIYALLKTRQEDQKVISQMSQELNTIKEQQEASLSLSKIETAEREQQFVLLQRDLANLQSRLPAGTPIVKTKKSTSAMKPTKSEDLQEVVQALTQKIVDKENELSEYQEQVEDLMDEKKAMLEVKEQLSQLYETAQSQSQRELAEAQTEVRELKLAGFQERKGRAAAEKELDFLKERLKNFHDRAAEFLQEDKLDSLNPATLSGIIKWFGDNILSTPDANAYQIPDFSDEDSDGGKEDDKSSDNQSSSLHDKQNYPLHDNNGNQEDSINPECNVG